MGSMIADLRRVLEAELAGLQARAGNLGFRIALLAIAGVIGLLGLLALELSAFLALATAMRPPYAALVTAVGTFLIAGLIAMIANGSKGRARLREIELQKISARQAAQQDVGRLFGLASLGSGALAALRRPVPRSPAATPSPEPAPLTPPALWRRPRRNRVIAAVAALGFAFGVSPALRRSLKRWIS